MAEKLLTVRNVTRQFGGLTAVNDVSMTIYDNELVALIGPNGAGKTTLFNMLSGLLPATSGTIAIRHDGRFYKVSGRGSHQRCPARHLADVSKYSAVWRYDGAGKHHGSFEQPI